MSQSQSGSVSCPKCGNTVNLENMKRHARSCKPVRRRRRKAKAR